MLYLVRRLEESIIIDDEIHIKIIELKRNSVKLGIKSTGEHSILRDELHRAMKGELEANKDSVENL